ncbi:MAG TPA: hypothetical protein ENL03_04970 [Phycisphaerae bacterium]|nr:hypothetical protein [Phycisphaerae bacterium]
MLIAAPWVHHDAKRVHANQPLWSAIAVCGILAAVCLWLVVGQFIVGMGLYIVLVGAVFGGYVAHRNSKVDEPYRVLTPRHISTLMSNRKSRSEQAEVLSRCLLYTADSSLVKAPSDDSDPTEIAAYNLAQELFFDLLWRRASQAEIVPKGQRASVRYVIDGVASRREPMEIANSQLLVDFLKKIANMDIAEHRRPQKGLISVEITAGESVEVMLSTAGSTEGQRLGIKIVQETIQTDLDKLGMSDAALDRLHHLTDKGGVLIVSGRSGSGVTSTLYSLLRTQDAYIKQLETLEAKAAIDLENVTQSEYGRKEKLTAAMTASLRHEPDVLMVDNCLDSEQAELIVNAGQKITVYLGMAASDSFTALAKWVKLCGNTPDAIERLNAVLCQILIRKLCPNCREPYRPDPALLAKANLAGDKIDRFYRTPTKPLTDEKGNEIICHLCQGSGYLGRTSVFELLELTDETRNLIRSGASLVQIKTAFRKNKMLYLQEQALRKVIRGTTSIQEVLRVTQPKTQAK